jgi:hypothetical protein
MSWPERSALENSTSNFSQKASMNMSSQSGFVVGVQKEVIADLSDPINPSDPPNPPDYVQIDLGGTLVFQNKYPDFDHFEIKFEKGPPDPDDTLIGTKEEPIVVHMPHEDKTFKYHIEYKKQDGTSKFDPRTLIARSCPGCR